MLGGVCVCDWPTMATQEASMAEGSSKLGFPDPNLMF